MKLLLPCILILLLADCNDDVPTVNLGLDDVYSIARMQKLPLRPALTGAEYQWTVDGKEVSRQRDYIFLSDQEGSYNIELKIIDPDTPYDFSFRIDVIHEEVEYSPYISRVYEYCPAPGQFVNQMPQYEDGDTYADMLEKAENCISGTNDIMISLGAYGGYVTFGFDHTVVNVAGEKDFRIWGNAFYELTDPDKLGGSAEPGIVMVSFDANCNGLPDDPFYELAGSEYSSPATLHNYSITYHRPEADHKPSGGNGNITDAKYIRWTDSQGLTGYVAKNVFHPQEYYPQWIDANELSFTGSCLPANGIDVSGRGTYFILYCYPWGYVDNHPNDKTDLCSFDISNAVDSEGRPVDMPGIDFVRVYTGVNQYCGWLGETSTEISRAADLHVTDPQLIIPIP